MRRLSLVLVLLLLCCAGCGRSPGQLHRPLPDDAAAVARLSLVPEVVGDSPAAAAQVQALLRRSLMAAGRLASAEAGSRLVVRVLAWELDPKHRILQREYWADDGGPTRMTVESLVVRDARAQVEAQVVAEDGSVRALEPVDLELPAQVGGGQDLTIRVRRRKQPVTLLRGSAAAVLDGVMRRAIAGVVLQVTPGERGEAIPLAAGSAAQDEALRLARGGQLSQAEVLLRAAVQVAPEDAAAVYNLGAVLDAQGRWPEALECYGQALALRPDDRWRAVAAACEAAAEGVTVP